MALIRILQPTHYSTEQRRYKSSAFSLGSDDSISVFDERCSIEESGSVCTHIARYYPNLAGQRSVFWRFELADSFERPLPRECAVTGKTGDVCHRNLRCFASRQSPRKVFREVAKTFQGLYVCPEEGTEPLPLTPDLLMQIHSVWRNKGHGKPAPY